MPPQIMAITAAPKYVVVCRIEGIQLVMQNFGKATYS